MNRTFEDIFSRPPTRTLEETGPKVPSARALELERLFGVLRVLCSLVDAFEVL
jgi:hypothetical protein